MLLWDSSYLSIFLFISGLTVFVDKRITLGAFKLKLEPYVHVQAENFKVSYGGYNSAGFSLPHILMVSYPRNHVLDH